MPAVVGGTAVVALIAGVTLGAAFGGGGASDSGNSEGPGATLSPTTGVAGGGAPSPAEIHAQDVSLCTNYAIINTAIPTPDTTGSDLLLRLLHCRTPWQKTPTLVHRYELRSLI